MLKKYEVPATFYVPAVAALLYPDEQRQVIAEGHEIGIHSWIHELNSVLSYEAESDIMHRAADTLEKITGVRPVGSRTASWDFSPHTLRITKEMGLLYDSSLMADEDCYELLLDGEPTGVVELPVEWIRDDAVYFMMHRFQILRPQMPVEAVFDIFRREFDMAYEEGGICQITTPSALHRLPLAHLDHRGADPPREVAAGRVVRDPRGCRRLRQGACRLMRIAVVADIHGNVRALRAVMDDLKQVAPDTRDQSRRLRVGSARGGRNRRRADQPRLDHHSRQSRPAAARPAGRRDGHGRTQAAFARAEEPPSRPGSRPWKTTATVEDIFLCHGTPGQRHDVSAGNRRAGRPRAARDAGRGRRAASAASMRRSCCADTAHVPRLVRLADGRTVVNPGQRRACRPTPMLSRSITRCEVGAPHARYAVLERAKAADPWRVSFRVVAYDWNAAGRPRQARRAARTGRSWLRTGYAS